MPHGNLPIYEKTCYGSGMKTDYEKAIEWLNKKAEKAGGITDLGKTVGAPASTFFRVLKGGSPPGADKLLDWISQLGGKIVFPDERMEGYTLIPKVVAQAGAGSSLITSDEVLGMYAFRDDFLRRVGVHAKESVMLDVIGHSMEPIESAIRTPSSSISPSRSCGTGTSSSWASGRSCSSSASSAPRAAGCSSRKTAISPTSWSKARISKPSVSTGGYAGSGGSSEGCPFQRESTRHTPIPAHRRSSPPPLCSPRQPTHLPECGPRKAPRRHGPPPGTAQCGHALLFPSLSRIAGHSLPPPASSPSAFLPS